MKKGRASRWQREAVSVPVIANGDVWTRADAVAIRGETGCEAIMLGRGAVADPFLARRIRGVWEADPAGDWPQLLPALIDYWQRVAATLPPRHAPGRLKQWLALLSRTWPEAARLAATIRSACNTEAVSRILRAVEP